MDLENAMDELESRLDNDEISRVEIYTEGTAIKLLKKGGLGVTKNINAERDNGMIVIKDEKISKMPFLSDKVSEIEYKIDPDKVVGISGV